MATVLVIGDATIDRRIQGRLDVDLADGVPRLTCERAEVDVGGAGRVAQVATAAGHSVTLASTLASGATGRDAPRRLETAGVTLLDLPSCTPPSERTTYVADGRTVLEVRTPCGETTHEPGDQLPSELPRLVGDADAVIAVSTGSDLLASNQLRQVLRSATTPFIWVQPGACDPVAGATAVLTDEAGLWGSGRPSGWLGNGYFGTLTARGHAMLDRWGAEAIAVHLYDDGVLWLARSGDAICVPGSAVESPDTALAAVAVAVAGGTPWPGTNGAMRLLPEAVVADG